MSDFKKHKNIIATIPNEVIINYCPPEEFPEKAERFFKDLEEQETDFRTIKYPFDGGYLLDPDNWDQIVKIAPEFIVSIIKLGVKNLININSTDSVVHIPQFENVAIENLSQSAAIIKQSWLNCNSWIESKYQDFDIRNQLFQDTDIITNPASYSDIRGCLQLILSEIKIRSLLPNDLGKNVSLNVPVDKIKRRILLKLTRDYTKIVNYFEIQPANTIINRGLNKLIVDINNYVLKNIDEIEIIGSSEKIKTNIERAFTYFKNNHNILFVGEHGTGRMHLGKYLVNKAARHEIYHCGASKDRNFENLMLDFEKEPSIHLPGYISQTWKGVLIFLDLEKATDIQKDKIYQLYMEKYSHPHTARRKLQLFATITPESYKNLDRNLKYKCFSKKISVPTLKEIQDDIPELALYFFKNQINKDHELSKVVTLSTFESLKQQEWKNNIVELKNFVESVIDDYLFRKSKGITDFNCILQERVSLPVINISSDVFDTIEISLAKNITNESKLKFRLSADKTSNCSEWAELSITDGTFLYFLALERMEGGNNWLIDPLEQRETLEKIQKKFSDALPPHINQELNGKPDNDKNSWVFGSQNTRSRYVSRIHRALEITGITKDAKSRSGPLLFPCSSDTQSGGFQLHPSIKNVIL